jgi:hypothetical protein
MITYIYLLENIEVGTNKIYIGKTIYTNVNNRKYTHRNKYGKQINFTIIDEINSVARKDWRILESYWIEQFKQWGFELINKNKGGGGPEYFSEAIKSKIRNNTNRVLKLKNNIERNRKISIALKNYKRTQDHNDKIRNRIMSPSHLHNIQQAKCKGIIQYNKQGEYIAEYSSIIQASRVLKLNYQNLSNHLRKCASGAKFVGGYRFEYKTL